MLKNIGRETDPGTYSWSGVNMGAQTDDTDLTERLQQLH